jgi:hypothetical protein
MDAIILPLLLAELGGQQRAAVLERMLPVMLPVPGNQRVAFTALLAQQQVQREAQIDEQLVEEAVNAAKFKNRDQLNPFPTLAKTFASLSAAAQARIFPPASATGSGTTGSRGTS